MPITVTRAHPSVVCRPAGGNAGAGDSGAGLINYRSRMGTSISFRLLQAALVVFGVVMILLYPLAAVWPSGWAWHHGAPHDSHYFMMIVGLYIMLGVFLCLAARNPQAYRSLIWFAVWSSVVHALVMAVESVGGEHHTGHLWGDVPALLLVAVVLAVLLRASGVASSTVDSPREVA